MHRLSLWIGRCLHRWHPTRADDACCSFCGGDFYTSAPFAEGPTGAMICRQCAVRSAEILTAKAAVLNIDEIRDQVNAEFAEKWGQASSRSRRRIERLAKQEIVRRFRKKFAESERQNAPMDEQPPSIPN